MNMWSNIFIIIAGMLWSVELIPQLYKTYKTKQTGDISLFYYLICGSAFVFFLAGVVLMKNMYLFFSHIIPFINLTILIIMIIRYRKNKVKNLCKYWIELDGKEGMYEYCKYAHKKVICCADKNQCEVRRNYGK